MIQPFLQGKGDEVEQITAKLETILEARLEQYSQADVHVGLGASQQPLGASPAVITHRRAPTSKEILAMADRV